MFFHCCELLLVVATAAASLVMDVSIPVFALPHQGCSFLAAPLCQSMLATNSLNVYTFLVPPEKRKFVVLSVSAGHSRRIS